MSTKTKTLNKVSTWLPGFDGFYGSLWDDGQEDQEIENINNERKRKGLEPITYDDCKWDYTTFFKTLSEDIARVVSNYLKNEENIDDIDIWIYEQTNDSNYICASNFDDLTKDK